MFSLTTTTSLLQEDMKTWSSHCIAHCKFA